jgi:PAS domain S-box-containing protein
MQTGTVNRLREGKEQVRLLAVEDNPGDYRLILELLEETRLASFKVHNASRLLTAINMLQEVIFDVVLLDLNLPDSQGLDTFSMLHEKHPEIPIVVLTGTLDEDLAIKAIDEGAQDYLFKDELTARDLSHTIIFAIERKKVERSLMEREETLRSFIENAPEAIGITRDGLFVYVNSKHLEIFGFERPEELIGRPILDLFAPQERDRAREGDRRLMQGLPEATENEFIGLRKDGSQFPFHVAVTKINLVDGPVIVGFLTDISDRKKAEDALKESEETFRSFIEQSADGVSLTDENNHLMIWNRSMEDITGMRYDAVIGQPLWNVIHKMMTEERRRAFDFNDYNRMMTEALTTGRGFVNQTLEMEVLRQDGQIRTLAMTSFRIKTDRGYRMGAIVRDITEEMLAEKKLAESKAAAELYLDLLTHDINNYNAAAISYLQLAEARLHLDEKDQKLIRVPLQELRNSTELIANIRDVQKVETGRARPQVLDVCQMLEEVKEDYENIPDREVVITVNDMDQCSVPRSSLLRDAFTNIVGNAIKHSSGPICIDIVMRNMSMDGKSYIRIDFEDNGPGIPDEMKERVFARSMRGLTKSEGYGLGLYLVKRLIEDMGGKVWVEDRVNGNPSKGARFVVLLPST